MLPLFVRAFFFKNETKAAVADEYVSSAGAQKRFIGKHQIRLEEITNNKKTVNCMECDLETKNYQCWLMFWHLSDFQFKNV